MTFRLLLQGKARDEVSLRRPRPRAFLAACLGIVILVACGDDSAGPRAAPGVLEARLASPHGPEGALLVEIDGPLGSVTTQTGHLFHHRAEGRTQVLVVLEDGGEIRFRIEVPDANQVPTYRIIEVSGPDDALRPDLAGYVLRFDPP